jgi:O-antigen/teichoic acid export membrane protein
MARASAANVVGAVLRLGATLAAVPLLFHALGAERFGTWVFVSAAVNLGAVIEGGNAVSTTVLLGRALARGDTEAAAAVVSRSRAIGLSLAGAALVGMFVFAQVGSGIIESAATSAGEMRAALAAGAVLLALRVVGAPNVGGLEALGRFQAKNVLVVVSSVVTAASSVVLAYATRRIDVMMLGTTLTAAGTVGAYAVLFRRELHRANVPYRRLSLAGARPQTRMSIGNALVTMAIGAFQQGDRLIVGAVAGPVTLGLYGVAVSIGSQLQALIAVISQPLTASQSGIEHRSGDSTLVRRILSFNASVCLLAAGAGLMAAPIASRALGNADVKGLAVMIGIAVCVYATIGLQSPAHYALLGEGRVRQVLVAQLTGAAIGLSAIFLAAHVGVEAALFANFGYAWTTQMLVPAAIGMSAARDPDLLAWRLALFGIGALGIALWAGGTSAVAVALGAAALASGLALAHRGWRPAKAALLGK